MGRSGGQSLGGAEGARGFTVPLREPRIPASTNGCRARGLRLGWRCGITVGALGAAVLFSAGGGHPELLGEGEVPYWEPDDDQTGRDRESQ